MADAVATKLLYDGPNYAIMHFTNVSDSTGETNVVKVDPATLAGAPTRVTIDRVVYATHGMGVAIQWDAAAQALAWVVPSGVANDVDFRDIGGKHTGPCPGLLNNAGAGVTGKITFSTLGTLAAGARYAMTLWMRKTS
jgi:hypothetical protein